MNLHDLKAWLDTHRPAWRTEPPEDVAAWANAPTVPRAREHRINEPTLYALFGAARGEQIIQALEVAAVSDAIAARVLGWLRTVGVNMGDAAAGPLLDSWAEVGLCTTEEAAALAALGQDHIGPAQAAGLGNVRALDVVRAGRL